MVIRCILRILHDPKYSKHVDLWYHSVSRPCRIFGINSMAENAGSPASSTRKIYSRNPRHPSIQRMPILGLKVCKYDLNWAIWIIWIPRGKIDRFAARKPQL